MLRPTKSKGAGMNSFWTSLKLQVVCLGHQLRPLLLCPLRSFVLQGLEVYCPLYLHPFPIEVAGYRHLRTSEHFILTCIIFSCVPQMKNQSARGADGVSLAWIGAIEHAQGRMVIANSNGIFSGFISRNSYAEGYVVSLLRLALEFWVSAQCIGGP